MGELEDLAEKDLPGLRFFLFSGMGRNSARVSSRRIASREGTNYFVGTVSVSDDEDDADWAGDKKRGEKKKLPKLATNVTKKLGKSS